MCYQNHPMVHPSSSIVSAKHHANHCKDRPSSHGNIASSHEACTWGKIIQDTNFGMGIKRFSFCTNAAKIRSSPKMDMLRPWVPEDIQIHLNSRFVATIKIVNQSHHICSTMWNHIMHATGDATKEFCIHSWVIRYYEFIYIYIIIIIIYINNNNNNIFK